MGSWPGRADAPALDALERRPFDHGDIGSQRAFIFVGRLVKVQVLIDGTALSMKEPCEYGHQVTNKRGMVGRFPHQVLLGGVGIVVVCYLVFYLLSHAVFLSRVYTGRLPRSSRPHLACVLEWLLRPIG